MRQGKSFETFAAHLDPPCGCRILYSWAEKHPEFLQAKQAGHILLMDFYESLARNQVLGIQSTRIPPGTVATKPNARLTMFMLAIHGKSVYGELLRPRDEPMKDVTPATIEFIYSDDKPKEVQGGTSRTEDGGGNGGDDPA